MRVTLEQAYRDCRSWLSRVTTAQPRLICDCGRVFDRQSFRFWPLARLVRVSGVTWSYAFWAQDLEEGDVL